MTGLRNWQQQRRLCKRKIRPRNWRRWWRRWRRKQTRRCAWVNFSVGWGGGAFLGPGNWRQRRWRCQRKTGLRTQWQRQRRWRRTRNIWRVRGIGDNNGGDRGSTMGPRNLQQWQRRRRRNMSTKTSTKTTAASAEDIWRVQGIRDNDRGGRGLTTGPMDWQQRRSVDFTCYHIAKSNYVSSLSRCCLVLKFFSSYSLFSFTERITTSTAIMWKIFLHQVYTNLAYVLPTYSRV